MKEHPEGPHNDQSNASVAAEPATVSTQQEVFLVFGMDPRQLGLLGFNLSAIGFIFLNVHFEGFVPAYVAGAYLIPQIHHALAALVLVVGAVISLIALRQGIVFTPGIALLLSGSVVTHVLNIRF